MNNAKENKKHSHAPSIRCGDWATGKWCAQAVGYKNPSSISSRVVRDIKKYFGVNTTSFIIQNRNKKNTCTGAYSFYNVPLLKRWADYVGKPFKENFEQGDLFRENDLFVCKDHKFEVEDVENIIYYHSKPFMRWLIKNEPKLTSGLFDKYIGHLEDLFLKTSNPENPVNPV